MNTIEAIMTRKSTRKFSDKPLDQETITTILKAGQSGPSAVNARPWQFIAVTDRETLDKMADANGAHAAPLKSATFAVLVCGDLDTAFQPIPEFWIIDGASACQNMILAAHDLGVGSVWLGTWPGERSDAQAQLFGVPEHIIPHSIIAFGYPEDGEVKRKTPPKFEEGKVHFNKW